MHYEFAVEPQFLTEDFKTFCHFIEKFGFHRGRLISEFPKKWKLSIYENCKHFSSMEIKKVSSVLQTSNMLIKSGRDFDNSLDWCANAELVHSSKPFHAIIASENPRGNLNVIVGNDLWLDTDNPLFDISFECSMEKTTAGFISATKSLITHSRDILFIDPFFNSRNFNSALQGMLAVINDAKISLRYYSSAFTRGETLEHRVRELENTVPQCIPKGLSLEITLLHRTYDFGNHNRFVLTERGGIKFPWGLDCLQHQKDTINIMDKPTHKAKYDEFDKIHVTNPTIIAKQFSIVGTANS